MYLTFCRLLRRYSVGGRAAETPRWQEIATSYLHSYLSFRGGGGLAVSVIYCCEPVANGRIVFMDVSLQYLLRTIMGLCG